MIKYLSAGGVVAETCFSSMQPNIWSINSLKDGLLSGAISPFGLMKPIPEELTPFPNDG